MVLNHVRSWRRRRHTAETPEGPSRLSVAGKARSREPTRGQAKRFFCCSVSRVVQCRLSERKQKRLPFRQSFLLGAEGGI